MDRMQDLLRRSRLLATIALIGAMALLVLLIAVPFVIPHELLPASALVFWGIFILIVALILGISAAYVLLTRAHEVEPTDLPPSRARASEDSNVSPATQGFQEASQLILQLLDGDERRLYRTVVQAGGAILQRDVVRLTGFSEAKVSRLLDRLEDRGLIVRERSGMTNRVRISDAWREKA